LQGTPRSTREHLFCGMAACTLDETSRPRSIHAHWVANVDAKEGELSVLEDQVITIDEHGRIASIVPRASFTGEIEVTLATHIVIPGLVNSHTHTPMAVLRGYADDLGLQEWLYQHIFPTEGHFVFGSQEMGKRFARLGSTLAIHEMLKTGTTCFNDMYFFGQVTAEVVKEAGLRAVLAPKALIFTPHGQNDIFAADLMENIEWCSKVANESSGRIYASLSPHAAYTCPEPQLKEAKAKFDEVMKGKPYVIHSHVNETAAEIADFKGVDGRSAIQTFDHVGMLRPGTVFAHCVHMTDEEIKLFADRGVSVAHNPRSNLKLGSGIARVPAMLAAGVNVCLGTDGAASNNGLDMLSEMQYCSLLAKGSSQDAAQVPALQALRIATINGAKALNLDKEIGSIAVGKAADLVAVDLGHRECAPVFDPLGSLVYTNKRDVTHVWVNGRCLVQNREVRTLKMDLKEMDELIKEIHEFRATMPGRSKQGVTSPLSLF